MLNLCILIYLLLLFVLMSLELLGDQDFACKYNCLTLSLEFKNKRWDFDVTSCLQGCRTFGKTPHYHCKTLEWILSAAKMYKSYMMNWCCLINPSHHQWSLDFFKAAGPHESSFVALTKQARLDKHCLIRRNHLVPVHARFRPPSLTQEMCGQSMSGRQELLLLTLALSSLWCQSSFVGI